MELEHKGLSFQHQKTGKYNDNKSAIWFQWQIWSHKTHEMTSMRMCMLNIPRVELMRHKALSLQMLSSLLGSVHVHPQMQAFLRTLACRDLSWPWNPTAFTVHILRLALDYVLSGLGTNLLTGAHPVAPAAWWGRGPGLSQKQDSDMSEQSGLCDD